MVALVADELDRLGAPAAAGPVVLQSFHPALLREIRAPRETTARGWCSSSPTAPWATAGRPLGAA